MKYLGHKSVKHPSCANNECFSYGLTPETGFDCSGFVYFLLNKIEFPFDQTIRHCSQFADRFGIGLDWEGRLAGDLVIWSNSTGRRPRHMGIMLNEYQYIHAPGTDGSVIRIDEVHEQIAIPKQPGKYRQFYFHNPAVIRTLALPQGIGRWNYPST